MTESIDNYKSGISGLPVSYTWRGHGSAIFIEFGELTESEKRNHPQGEYSVMLDCDWRIENANEILCGSFSEQDEIEASIAGLENDRVLDIELMGLLPEIAISFSSGKRVLSFTSEAGQPEWTLFLPDKSWLCSKNGSLAREKAEQVNQ
jgi:hypothetical protein